ncbi:MAG: DNA-directed RNA polymerase subunit A' [Candidatus Woesearchaeota archaeon]|nr:DNA-directed RNA polymerase subunit A' [Candidatus Woesearchaeota archaeon]
MPGTIYKKVESILFGLLSAEDIKKMSSVKIITPELYDKEGYPVDGGLMDTRLGVIDPGLRCKTCGSKLKECMGHFGFIDLARPVVHVKYIRVILDVLRSVCRECNRILLDEQEIEKYRVILDKIEKEQGIDARRKRTSEIINSLKNIKKCPHCKAKQYTIKIEKPTSFYEHDKRLSPIEIRSRLEKVPDKDIELLGLNPRYARPEGMILTVLLIPPVTIRPSITLESGERSEDDLTHKLGDIVRINQRLFENINAGAPEIIVEDLWDLLQYHVTTYFDNAIAQVPPARHGTGQPLKTLTERIKDKEGRFRHNLAGKRVNFAARTVISPDPEIQFNEVGVPKVVAMELTIPEMVTEWNIERLKEFIKRGPDNYPGANYIIKPDGKKKKITDNIKDQLIEELQEGFIIERHLMDGDVAIFNRQPSLHRMSIMCHLIRVLPGKSFRLNPGVCTPYNADFDGDEMNLHIPQTQEARSEAKILMQVQTQIMTPKNGQNIIGCIEDSVTGNYLLTKEGIEFTREEATNILISIGIDDINFKKEKISGKEIFSVILPKDFNFIGRSKNCDKCEKCKHKNCPRDAYLCIEKGELLCGIIDNKSIGKENGVLLREIYRRYGEDFTLRFIEKVFKLGIQVLLRKGFTITLSDTDLKEEIKQEINVLFEEADKNVQKFIDSYYNNELEALPGKTLRETLELRILELLNKTRNKIGTLIVNSAKENIPTLVMARSGAEGSTLNLVQMSACVGQQALGGKRIERGYKNRPLSLFKKNDLGGKAHGFVSRGFKNGLKPYEFFFHAMTGRDSLMDTALRTPKSGYLYRRLANALQDLKVEYDNTIRDANKNIIQFKYGEDGIDVSKSSGGKIDVNKIVKEILGE